MYVSMFPSFFFTWRGLSVAASPALVRNTTLAVDPTSVAFSFPPSAQDGYTLGTPPSRNSDPAATAMAVAARPWLLLLPKLLLPSPSSPP